MTSLMEAPAGARTGAQPMPIGLQVLTVDGPGHPWTVIVRCWNPGAESLCRLCPRCTADPHHFCTIVTPGAVDPAAAALFVLADGEALGLVADRSRASQWPTRPRVVAPGLDRTG